LPQKAFQAVMQRRRRLSSGSVLGWRAAVDLAARRDRDQARRALGAILLANKLGECDGVERRGDSVAHTSPEVLRRAAIEAVADDLHIALGRADHRRDRPFEGAHDLAHAQLLWGATQPVASMRAACGLDQTSLAQTTHELLQVLHL